MEPRIISFKPKTNLGLSAEDEPQSTGVSKPANDAESNKSSIACKKCENKCGCMDEIMLGISLKAVDSDEFIHLSKQIEHVEGCQCAHMALDAFLESSSRRHADNVMAGRNLDNASVAVQTDVAAMWRAQNLSDMDKNVVDPSRKRKNQKQLESKSCRVCLCMQNRCNDSEPKSCKCNRSCTSGAVGLRSNADVQKPTGTTKKVVQPASTNSKPNLPIVDQIPNTRLCKRCQLPIREVIAKPRTADEIKFEPYIRPKSPSKSNPRSKSKNRPRSSSPAAKPKAQCKILVPANNITDNPVLSSNCKKCLMPIENKKSNTKINVTPSTKSLTKPTTQPPNRNTIKSVDFGKPSTSTKSVLPDSIGATPTLDQDVGLLPKMTESNDNQISSMATHDVQTSTSGSLATLPEITDSMEAMQCDNTESKTFESPEGPEDTQTNSTQPDDMVTAPTSDQNVELEPNEIESSDDRISGDRTKNAQTSTSENVVTFVESTIESLQLERPKSKLESQYVESDKPDGAQMKSSQPDNMDVAPISDKIQPTMNDSSDTSSCLHCSKCKHTPSQMLTCSKSKCIVDDQILKSHDVQTSTSLSLAPLPLKTKSIESAKPERIKTLSVESVKYPVQFNNVDAAPSADQILILFDENSPENSKPKADTEAIVPVQICISPVPTPKATSELIVLLFEDQNQDSLSCSDISTSATQTVDVEPAEMQTTETQTIASPSKPSIKPCNRRSVGCGSYEVPPRKLKPPTASKACGSFDVQSTAGIWSLRSSNPSSVSGNPIRQTSFKAQSGEALHKSQAFTNSPVTGVQRRRSDAPINQRSDAYRTESWFQRHLPSQDGITPVDGDAPVGQSRRDVTAKPAGRSVDSLRKQTDVKSQRDWIKRHLPSTSNEHKLKTPAPNKK